MGADNGMVHHDQMFVPVAITNDREPSIPDDIALHAFQRGPSSLIFCYTNIVVG